MRISVVIFWIVALCGLVFGYQCFERAYCLHIQGCNRAPKIVAICFSETSVSTYKQTQCYNPVAHLGHLHRSEKHESHLYNEELNNLILKIILFSILTTIYFK
jgi:hypothetical protein